MPSKETALGGSQDDPQFPNGVHAKPTRLPLSSREGSPRSSNTSGMENAMADLADKEHSRGGR